MNTEWFKSSAKNVVNGMRQNSPTILTGLAVAGVASTAILAVRATPKALQIIRDEEEAAQSRFEAKHIVMLTWKCYIPAGIMGAATIACIIGANSINLRRNAALASIYSLTETTLKEYQAKVIETIGEKKEQAIKESIAQDRLDKNPLSSNQVIFTGYGDSLCYDSISGRYFKSDYETLRKIENDINYRLVNNVMYISLNDVYDEMGLPRSSIGDNLGWNVEKKLHFLFTSKLAEGGQPCVVIDYSVDPMVTFRD